jgi:D-alanyl-lipoteichoic acid acyltransferase DltB (MBOAT superfamily)
LLLSSSTYFIFLFAVLVLYWPLSRSRAASLGLLLLANYFFYAKWDIWYLALIPVASTIDFCIGIGLQDSRSRSLRRCLVGASVVMNIGLLLTLRYASVWQREIHSAWHWSLPLSLSFYAFQALTYTIDVYRGDAKGTSSYLAHLTAVSFFPTTLAGPITRVSSLIKQLEQRKPLLETEGSRALFLIATGLIKKFLIADYLASNLVNRVFDFPNLYTGSEVLLAVYAYAVQIYCDFSGYTDIAVGSALLLGIQLPVNFNRPYAAENIADFWRRWHISLSNWLRDYLYFSLPGKRGKVMPYVNLVITMVLGGLWHGASWSFAVWGALHGIGLAAARLWQSQQGRAVATSTFSRYLRIVLTFHFVAFAWIFFRAPDLNSAWAVITRIASLSASFANISAPLLLVLTIGLLAHYVPKVWHETSMEYFAKAPFYAQAVVLLLLVLGLQSVISSGTTPFIYTKF